MKKLRKVDARGWMGRAVGLKFGKAAEIVGGVALIVLGTTILLEHMGVLG